MNTNNTSTYLISDGVNITHVTGVLSEQEAIAVAVARGITNNITIKNIAQ